MEFPLRNIAGETAGTLTLNPALFDVPMNQALVHQVAVAHMANARQGTSSTKTRGMVSGGGAKPWRQKHTGRARQGSSRSPQWRGGGIVFGPHPRSYSQRIPKKMNLGSLKCLLSQKIRDDKLIILDKLNLDDSNTKHMVQVLSNLGVDSPCLLVTEEPELHVIKSARNIRRVKTLPSYQLNTVDLLSHDRVVITADAVRRAERIWCGEESLQLEQVE